MRLPSRSASCRSIPFAENVEQSLPRGFRAPISRVDDHALFDSIDCGVRFIDEAPQIFGEPVVAPGLTAIAVHALLYHDPVSVIGDDEAMEIKIKPILERRAVDLGDNSARPGERCAVETDPVTDREKLMRGAARVTAASTANKHECRVLRTRVSGRASARR
jgi:hypothetical protein